MIEVDVVVIGGGQAGLAVGFYLRRTGLSYVILDDEHAPGGAWQRTWDSLRLFSPAQWSSLPGYQLPRGDEYPSRDDVVRYLADYERRYALPVHRPVRVDRVSRSADEERLIVSGTRAGERVEWSAGAVVSATGNWANPYVPEIPGASEFRGVQLHSANYRSPRELAGRSVVVVGGGNSGAQIVAELSDVATVEWATLGPPVFLPDDVDGRFLFEQATLRFRALQEGRVPEPPRSLGDIVVVPPVRAARDRGALEARRMFERFTEDSVVWNDDSRSRIDVVIWATGFRPALSHLAPLAVVDERGRIDVVGTRAVRQPRLWVVGYGEWTGFASATLIGVGRSARATVDEIVKSSGNRPINAG